MPNQTQNDVLFFRLESLKPGDERNMPSPIAQPEWNQSDKEGSLERYADWLNQIARMSFLKEGHHPQMFIFFTGQGEIEGCQFRDGFPQKQRDGVVFREAARINPFGTIQILMIKIYDPKLFPELKHQNVRFVGSDDSNPKALKRDCLMVRMESRTGRVKQWINPVVKEGACLKLGDAVDTYPAEDADCD